MKENSPFLCNPCFSSFLFKNNPFNKLFLSQQYGLNNQMNNEYSFFLIDKDAFLVIPLTTLESLFSFFSFLSQNNQQQNHYKSTYIFFSIYSLSHSFHSHIINESNRVYSNVSVKEFYWIVSSNSRYPKWLF